LTTASPPSPSPTRASDLACVQAMMLALWLADGLSAWAMGVRWPSPRFLLPSLGFFLSLGWVAVLPFVARRRRAYPGAALLVVALLFMFLAYQRLGARNAAGGILLVALALAQAAVLWAVPSWPRRPSALLIAAAPLVVLGYHSGKEGPSPVAATAVALSIALAGAGWLVASKGVAGAVSNATNAVGALGAFAGMVAFAAWIDRPFTVVAHDPLGYRKAEAAPREHVVLVVVDTLRADRLGVYGYRERPTSPFLDRWAAEGTVLTRAYASSSWTVPSMATMFTGELPEDHGVTIYGRRLRRDQPVLAERFQGAGYHTVGVVANPLLGADLGFARGFDTYVLEARLLSMTGSGSSVWSDVIMALQKQAVRGLLPAALCGWTVKPTAANVVDEALTRLDQAPRGAPLFLLVMLLDPHEPRTRTRIEDDATRGWRQQSGDRDFDGASSLSYDREVRYVDGQIERLWIGLERRLGAGRTRMIVVADHGEQLGEKGRQGHGRNLEEAVTRVPLLIRSPHDAARRLETLFSLRRLPELLLRGADPAAWPENVVRTQLRPPERPSVLVRAAQDADWKLVETVADGVNGSKLFRLPDEDEDYLARRPDRAAALAPHLLSVHDATAAPIDEEAAARLRSLGYVK
jgi:arylsulfatase A-like enzyme